MDNTSVIFQELFKRYPSLAECKNEIYNVFTAMSTEVQQRTVTTSQVNL